MKLKKITALALILAAVVSLCACGATAAAPAAHDGSTNGKALLQVLFRLLLSASFNHEACISSNCICKLAVPSKPDLFITSMHCDTAST